jgi:hypothetical protein
MNNPLFYISLIFGITMIIEGFYIIMVKQQTVPIPSKILFWIGIGLVGREKSTQKFTGKNTPENLHTYAIFVLIFGASLIVSSFIYLMGSQT